ncbi:GIY-YIG nuclease family protein [Paucibacter sp. B51]|uniref:GIY-YIG nuclease family protein n=1 Tax=Paucibacter sp. B51 TaxID=2993315 RepID=UPI003FA6BF1B
MRKWFHVSELTGDRLYVGISDNFIRRHRQHMNGKGAMWSRLHESIRVLFRYQYEVANDESPRGPRRPVDLSQTVAA